MGCSSSKQPEDKKSVLEKSPTDIFQELDTDGDGVLSLDEIKAGAERLGLNPEEAEAFFRHLDVDGSGGLDKGEFSKKEQAEEAKEAVPEEAKEEVKEEAKEEVAVVEEKEAEESAEKEMFAQLDDDGDGVLTINEIEAGAEKLGMGAEEARALFAKLDTNGNGEVDLQEFLAAKDDDSWLFEDKDDKESAKSEVFHKLDLDGNGVLTLDELQTGAAHLGLSVEEATELFATLDKNGNGEIDLKEFLKAKDHMFPPNPKKAGDLETPDGFSLLQSELGTYLAMNFESHKAGGLPVRCMHLDPDGIPVKGMLWKMTSEGALVNKATGMVMQIENESKARKIRVCCEERNRKVRAQLWRYTKFHTIVSGANGYVLTVRNGSKRDRAEVWTNIRVPIRGITTAQRWHFVPYDGDPKYPTYPVAEEHKALLERAMLT